MALVDVIEMATPSSGALKSTLLTILNVLAPKIRDAADPASGVWWLVLTQPGRAKNYFESSGAMMYVYSLLKAVRLGYVADPDGSIVAAMKKAYGYAVANWVVTNSDGTMSWMNTVSVRLFHSLCGGRLIFFFGGRSEACQLQATSPYVDPVCCIKKSDEE